jgi:hypothetical protein
MSLKSTAQSISGTPVVVLEQSGEVNHNDYADPIAEFLEGDPTELVVDEPESFERSNRGELEVMEPEQGEDLVIEFIGLPGAPNSPEPVIEVDDKSDEGNLEVAEKDSDDTKKSKKSERWDWESKGATGFLAWIKERFDTVPKHSGYDTAGLERAVSYLEKLDSEISKAMRLDLDGELDANKIEEIRAKIEEGIDRLYERLDKIKQSKKTKRKRSDVEISSFIKEAQKITGVKGIYIMAPLFASRIARICINGMVSGGHDIEEMFSKQVKKWKLTDREQAEVMQLLADMGYPLRQDRGYMPDEDFDISVDDQFDWAANFKG